MASGVKGGVSSIENVTGSLVTMNTLYGNDDDNILVSGVGDDIMIGRGGNDTYVFDTDGPLGVDIVDESAASGGGGLDTLDFSSTQDQIVEADLSVTGSPDPLFATYQTVNGNLDLALAGTIENIIGGDKADILTGNGEANQIDGGPGDDELYGGDGSDRYIFSGNWGNDTVSDTSGNETFDFSAIAIDLIFDLDLINIFVSAGSNSASGLVSEIEDLVAGSGNDRFDFASGARLNGILDAGPGNDTLNFAAYGTGRSIVLNGLGSTDGYQGTDSSVPGGFDNVERINGTVGADTLTGLSLNSHWTVATPIYTYEVDGSGRALTFTDFESLVGLSADDVYTITATSVSSPAPRDIDIWAGAGNDALVMLDTATLTGFFDGQGDYDTIDYTNYTSARTFSLVDALGIIDGSNVTEATVSDSFFNIQQILGSSVEIWDAGDALYGRDTEATFDIVDGVDIYIDVTNNRSLQFNGIEDLHGGTLVDTFNMTADHIGRLFGHESDDFFNVSNLAVLTGSVDGGAGYDELNYTNYDTARAFDLTAVDVDGFDGTESSLIHKFYNVDWILGTNDAVNIDFLQGLGSDGEWQIFAETAKSHYLIQGSTLDFSFIDSLIGEGGVDDFVFQDTVVLKGSIDGGAGFDTLDYGLYTTARDVILTLPNGADGFAGQEKATLGLALVADANGFTHINQILGSTAADRLQTLDDAVSYPNSTFTIDDPNGGTYSEDISGNTLDFTSFDHLLAGAGEDWFKFMGAGSIDLSVDAGAGTDLIDYSTYGSSVWVNLSPTNQTITSVIYPANATIAVNKGLADGISNFENLTGSIFDDVLVGDDAANMITGLEGNDQLHGLGGDDTYLFDELWGVDIVVDTLGVDTFNFSTTNVGVSFQVTDPGLTVIDGLGNQVSNLPLQIEHLVGGAGVDILDYSMHSNGQNIILDRLGTLDGYAGRDTTVGSFDNINTIFGGTSADSLTGMASPVADSTFNVILIGGGTYTEGTTMLNFSAFDTIIGLDVYDTLTFNGFGSARSATLSGVDVNGFSGGEASIDFVGIDELVGTVSNSDTLIGMNNAAEWEVDTDPRYIEKVSGFDYDLDIASFENLTGGDQADTFVILVAHTGRLDGGAGMGYDTLDYSSYGTAFDIVLTGLGSEDGFVGEENNGSLSDGFTNINKLVGGAIDDSLTGMNVPYAWNISATLNQYVFGSHEIEFDHVEQISGGSADDTFNILETGTYWLFGGAGNDVFIFSDNITYNGLLDGETGSDSIDFRHFNTAVQVNLNVVDTNVASTNYPALTAQDANGVIVNDFVSIENAAGGTQADLLIGDDGDNLLSGGPGNDELRGGRGDDTYLLGDGWGQDTIVESSGTGNDTISAALATLAVEFNKGVTVACPSGTCITQAGNSVIHQGNNIENFTGGAGADSFTFANNNSLPGNVDGLGGLDTLDFSASTVARTFTLTGLGSLPEGGYTGTVNGIGGIFDHMDALVGTSANDALIGLDSASLFNIDGVNNAYTELASGQVLGLTSIDSLVGGTGDDTFAFSNTASIAGTIDGGNGAGLDSLDYSNYAQTISVNLAGGTATGTSGISNIENLIGSPFGNIIWGDDGPNTFTIDSFGATAIVGLLGDDTYIFDADSALGDVTIDESLASGGGGTDTISFQPTTTVGVSLDLSTTSLVQAVNANLNLTLEGTIENAIGGSLDDTLIGADLVDNQLTGGLGDDNLQGGSGNDTYLYENVWDHDTVIDTNGIDTIDFSRTDVGVRYIADPATPQVVGGTSQVDVIGVVIENLIGGLGVDTLDLSSYLSARSVTLDQPGTLDGFGGSVDTINPLIFDNINDLVGSSINGDHLIGLVAGSRFHITGSDAGDVEGTLTFSSFENLDGNAGLDILDYSQFAGNSQITLTGLGAVDGFRGTGTNLTGGFINFNLYVGNAAFDATLIGQDSGATFFVQGNNQGTVDGAFSFQDVNNLGGGSGIDTIDYSLYPQGVTVNLSTQTAEGLSGIVAGIENINGSPMDDDLTGDADANTLNGGGGADTLSGDDGNDLFVFNPGWGSGDTVVDSAGDDTITFAGVDFALTTTFNSASFAVSGDGNSVSHNGDAIETIITSSGDDIFEINAPASINLDGAGGTNTLDFSSHAGPVTVNLATGTATDLNGTTFQNIHAFIGSGHLGDKLIGYDAGTTFNVTALDDGNVNNAFNFTGVENLTGRGGNDLFALIGLGELSGAIAGGAGDDTLSYAAYAGGSVVIGLDVGSATGLGTFSGVDSLIGSSQDDTIIGQSAGSTFVVTGNDAGTADGIDFISIENISGLGNNDDFEFIDGASLSGVLDGGAGSNSLDFSSRSDDQTVRLTGLGSGAVDGFTGSVDGVLTTFDHIDEIAASAAVGLVDTLVGLNADATWKLDVGQYISTNSLNFSGFDALLGGSGEDTFDLPGALNFSLSGGGGKDSFDFYNATAFTGFIDGGSDMDTLDYSQVTSNVEVNFATGSATGVNAGAVGSVINVENLLGGSGDNTITGDSGDNTYSFSDNWGVTTVDERPISGGGGNDTIEFSGVTLLGSGTLTFTFDGVVFTIEDSITGSIVNTDIFIENFVGGPTNDDFVFINGAVLNGYIDGGLGVDTLDYSGYDSPRHFTLTKHGTQNGYRGTEASLAGGFDNINALIGTALVSPDSLIGMNAIATWEIDTGSNQYSTDATHSLEFSRIEDLLGNGSADVFAFQDTATHTGIFDGGGGLDTLDYSAYSTTICANLDNTVYAALLGGVAITCQPGSTTALNAGAPGSLFAFENLTGGTAADLLIGNDLANIITGNAGNDEMYGNSGNDAFIIDDLWGNDNVYENLNEGIDLIDLTQVDADLDIVLNSIHIDDNALGDTLDHAEDNLEVIYSGKGDDTFTLNGNHSVSLYGGAGSDQFVFADGSQLSGLIDGQAGNDTISAGLYSSPLTATLTDIGSEDGLSGRIITTIAGSTQTVGTFTNLDQLLGGQNIDTLVGRNAAALWELDGSDRYLDVASGQSLGFDEFEILQGGSSADFFDVTANSTYILRGEKGNDTFSLDNLIQLTGTVDGGGGANTVDFSRYAIPRNFRLTGLGSQVGFTGTDTANTISGGFDNITRLCGGTAIDSLTGLNSPSVWHITGSGDYTSQNRSLEFEEIETLNGSAYDDQFIFNDGVHMFGNIDGRGGTDTIDFRRFTTGIYVDLSRNIANNLPGFTSIVSGGLSSIENVLGGSGNDTLIGDDRQNMLDGGPGIDNLDGRDGDDTFYSGNGFDTIQGGSGYDTLYVTPEGTYIAFSIENIVILWPPEPEPVPEPVPVPVPAPVILPDVIEEEQIGLVLAIGIPVTGYLVPRIVPVLSEEKVALIEYTPTILVLLEPEQYENSFFELKLMSVSPYYEANLGDQVFFPVGSGDAASLKRESVETLPDRISEIDEFVSAMTVSIYADELLVGIVPNQQLITLSFIIPEELIGREFIILYWDQTLDNGLGGWVEIDTTVLYWDARLNNNLGGWIDAPLSDVELSFVIEGRAVATVNFTGTFMLVVVERDG